jgi:hypothetical protein
VCRPYQGNQAPIERKRMSEAPDMELQDEQMVEEIHLVTELMVLASMTSGELDQEVIDNALGIERASRPFPTQRGVGIAGHAAARTAS